MKRTRAWLNLVFALAVAGQAAAQQTAAAEYDVVIRNGRVFDGAGNPWILADVGIKDGRFAAIGHVTGRGRTELDARGKYVTPGWIDMMDQSISSIARNPLAENKLFMGVTTAIAGEGGPPVSADSLAAYFRRLETQGISINIGTYYNEGQARAAVLGMSARAPSAEELTRMQNILATAMRAGALGMTTALIYPPHSFATTDELVEMAKVAARHGGIYASHIRGEGKELLEAIAEAIAIGERASLPVEVFHLKAAYQPGWGTLMKQAGALIDSARARGVDVAADMYPYTAGGSGLEATIPSWAHEGGTDSLKARLARPDVRARLKREVRSGSPGWWNIVEAAGGWNGIVLVNARNEANKQFEGKTIAQIAKEKNAEPADVAWDLVAQGAGRVMAIYHMMSEPDVETALRFPWTSIGSDAGAALGQGQPDLGLPHPRSYGTFPRVIARYVKERNVLSLAEAIRKMTSWPATRMRLADRGVIRQGAWADVVVFDLATIADRATYEKPFLYPDGIEYVLVNGKLVVDHGRHTGERAGQVLYGRGRTTTTTTASATSLFPPFMELRVPKPPTLAHADGKTFLVHELHVTNFAAQTITLKQVDVVAAGDTRQSLLTLADTILARSITRPGQNIAASERSKLTPGSRAVVFLWTPVAGGAAPTALRHRITIDQSSGDSTVTREVEAPSITVARDPAVIGPPLRGGVWLAANGPAPETGHRRALIPISGLPAIAQRFAIDYVKVDDQHRTFDGDRLRNSSYHAYGADAIAVANGVVVAVKDSIPENVPGPSSRAVPITLETVGGNHVIIDIGSGRYAFYAHLQPGSLRVRTGERVRRGQVLGLVGNSGNSTEPHLHFHLSDGNSPLASEGIPYGYDSFEVVGRCRTFNMGCERTTSSVRKNEVPLANALIRFPEK